MLNLALNARDAMPLGGDLTVSTRNLLSSDPSLPAELEPGDYVMIAVNDTGEGMAEEVRQKAFEPFFTTKGQGKGTGLGLSTVFGLAAQLGGTVTLESEPQKGTTVTVYLRRAIPVAGLRQIDSEGAASAHRPLNVLLVDDDAAVRHMACEMLQDAGNVVVTAQSGREALDILARGDHFDILVTDYIMPLMLGNQLATEVRRQRPNLPILFMTGYMEEDASTSWSDLGGVCCENPSPLPRSHLLYAPRRPALQTARSWPFEQVE